MKQFIIKLALFSILIFIADYSWNAFMPEGYFIPKIWFIFGFFVCIIMVFHFFMVRAATGEPQKFIRFYMGSTALRMALCIIVIIVYRFIDKPTVIPFSLAFIVHYFLFTIFEVTSVLRHLRK